MSPRVEPERRPCTTQIRTKARRRGPSRLPAILLVLAVIATGCTTATSNEEGRSPSPASGDAAATEASSPPTSESTPIEGGTVTEAVAGNFGSFDPIGATASGSLEPALHMFDRLWDQGFEEDDSGALVPVLVPNIATSDVTARSDQEFEFTVRTDGVFHDGEPVTVDDVAFSINRAVGGPDDLFSVVKLFVDYVDEAVASGEDTIVISTSRPVTSKNLQWALSSVGVVPRHVIEEVGDDEFSRNPIGSGPYKLVEAVDGEVVRIERFSDYVGPHSPRIDSINYRIVPDEGARVAALRAGEIDIAKSVPLRDLELLETEGFVADARPSQAHTTLMFNNLADGTADQSVRQALMYAIDREAIVETVQVGHGRVGNGPLADFHPDYQEPETVYDYDPDRALELLREAGYEDPSELTLSIRSGTLVDTPLTAQLVADNWRDLGINVELELVPDGTLFGGISDGDTDYHALIVSGDTSVLTWDGRGIARWVLEIPGSQFNQTPEVETWNDLMDQVLITEGAENEEAWKEALDFYAEVAPVHTLVFRDNLTARADDTLGGLGASLLMDLRSAHLIDG